MHTLHWLAVEAGDKDEALESVEAFLNDNMGDGSNALSWYDWFVIGGGRFNTEGNNAYDTSDNMVISLKENGKEAFTNKIAECLRERVEEIADLRKGVDMSKVNAYLDSYDGNWDFYALGELVTLKSALKLATGEWSPDSYFFDTMADTTNSTYVLKAIDHTDDNKDWFLVPVDFHY